MIYLTDLENLIKRLDVKKEQHVIATKSARTNEIIAENFGAAIALGEAITEVYLLINEIQTRN